MVKRIAASLLGFTLLMLLLAAPLTASAASYSRVLDDADLLTDTEEASLQQQIEAIQDTWQVDAVIMTTYDMPTDNSENGYSSWQWVNNYYDNHGYGIGKDSAGFLFVIDMHNRWPVLSTNGIVTQIVTSGRSEAIFNACDRYLPYSNYAGCCAMVLRSISDYLADAAANGNLVFDETGLRDPAYHNPLTASEIMLALGCGLAGAIIVWGVVASRYSLKGGTYRFNVLANAHRRLTRDDQDFINHHVARVRLPDPSSHSGGGHGGGTFSGGGGGGGHGGGTGHHF